MKKDWTKIRSIIESHRNYYELGEMTLDQIAEIVGCSKKAIAIIAKKQNWNGNKIREIKVAKMIKNLKLMGIPTAKQHFAKQRLYKDAPYLLHTYTMDEINQMEKNMQIKKNVEGFALFKKPKDCSKQLEVIDLNKELASYLSPTEIKLLLK